MSERRKRYLLDVAERVGWTALQVVLSVIAVDQLDLPTVYVPLIAAALAAAKGFVAGKVGQPGTASTLPQDADPAAG